MRTRATSRCTQVQELEELEHLDVLAAQGTEFEVPAWVILF